MRLDTPFFETIDVPVNEGNIEVTIGPKEWEYAWDNGKVTTEPTCIAEGVMIYTCTEAGLTEGTHCDACGEVFVVQTEVPDKPEKPNNGFGWIGDIIGNWFGKWGK